MSRNTVQLISEGAGWGADHSMSRSRNRFVSDLGCDSAGCAGRGQCGGRSVADLVCETVRSGLVR